MALDLLAEYRKRAGLTQKQVGDYIGISSQAVSKWEKGQSEPDVQSLRSLAKLYNVTVDELVGNASLEESLEGTAEKKETKISAFTEMLKRNRKKAIIFGCAVLGVIAILLSLLIFWSSITEKIAYGKFEKIELGMSMETVEGILGKPDETYNTHIETDDSSLGSALGSALSQASAERRYGYLDADFWYYRGNEYKDNEKADLNFEWGEFKPYYQIRITFNAQGKVIEAYFNTETAYDALDDYGAGESKTLKSVEYLNRMHTKARLCFQDGSAYLGKVEEMDDYLAHPWGDQDLLPLDPSLIKE